MKKRIAAAAILMCAVMVLVAGAPLVTADTHHIVKGAQGPRASAVSWTFAPADSGVWYGHIVNAGLRSLVVDVNDVTSGAAMSILHQRIRFAAYPTNTLDTLNATMAKGHTYNITATPNGARGTQCTLDDVFTAILPPVASFTASVVGATASVDGSGSSDPNVGASIKSWGWEWGDGTTGSGVTATHTYLATGDYMIVLTVLSTTGMTASASQTVHADVVDQPPVPMFTYTTLGWTVSVDATLSTDDHGIVSYAWSWGDGSPDGSGMKTTHTYAASGSYDVTLTVTDAFPQSASLMKTVTVVDNPPVAMFSASVTSLTASFDASASTDDIGIASYAWNFGDMSTGTGKVTSHVYAAQGTYLVTLTVTDTVGQTGVLAKDVLVADNPPVAAFSASSSSWTLSVDASASSDDYGIVSYAWDFGDMTTGTGKITTHKYAASNVYNVKLTVTDTIGQTNELTKPVTVIDNPPVAQFTPSVAGVTLSVDASASTDDYGISSYAWDFGDMTTGTGKTATHLYGASGTYAVKLTVTDTVGQTNSLTQPVDIIKDLPPVASFSFTTSSWTLSVDATLSTDDHGIVGYDWNWGDGSAHGSGVMATHTYSASKTYTVTLTVTDTIGQIGTSAQSIQVIDNPPVAAFSASATAWTVSVDASASADDYGIVSYQWNFGDSASATGKTATHKYTASGTYTITLTVTDTVGQTGVLSKPVTVTDNPPVAAFTLSQSGFSVNVDASTSTDDWGIVSFAWDFGDGATATGVTAAHTYAHVLSATFTVKLTVTDVDSQTGVATKTVQVSDSPPVASFTATANGFTVNVDASASSDDYGIVSYDWDWGTAAPHSSGVTATHTYTASGSPPVPFSQHGVMIPPPPFLLYGYTKDTAGLPLINCVVTITNQRTLDSVQVISDDGIIIGDPGFYSYDLSGMPNGYAAGDHMLVTATSPSGATGSATGILGTDPYLGIDVTLTGAQPVTITVTITLTVTDTMGQVSSASKTLTLTQ